MGRGHRDRPDEPELHRPLDRQLVLAAEHRQVLADGLRSDRYHGPDLRRQFFRLHENGRRSAHPGPNPARPNLVLNATIGSRSYDEDDPVRAKLFGTVFTFTHEDFAAKLNSDVADYELARAVMASATFPAAFNYMTLRDFHEPPDCPDHGGVCYVHVFDGGNSDNLGLISIKRVLLSGRARATREYERIVVVFVDAFRRSLGVSPSSADPRGLLSYVIDTNFLDATDSLLEANRQRILEEFFARTIAAYARGADCRRDSPPDPACGATRTRPGA